jgi:hypothetical protein
VPEASFYQMISHSPLKRFSTTSALDVLFSSSLEGYRLGHTINLRYIFPQCVCVCVCVCVCPIHPNFLRLISRFKSPDSVNFHRSSLLNILGHHILNIDLRHLLMKDCNFLSIFLVTYQVSHPYKITDLTQALSLLYNGYRGSFPRG